MASKNRSKEEGEGSDLAAAAVTATAAATANAASAANDAAVAAANAAGKKPKVNDTEKPLYLNATNFNVGRFSRRTAIVIKIYFKKMVMAWEILEGGGMSKMEIPFSNIVACDIDLANATLRFMLNDAPKFFRDISADGKRQASWGTGVDFTNGEASVKREFSFSCWSEDLEKFQDKILLSKSELKSLLKQQPKDKDPNT